MTYTELLQAVQDYAANTEVSFVAHIPEFIRATENRIFQEADLPLVHTEGVLATVAGAWTIDLSTVTGYVSLDSVAITVAGIFQYLDNKAEEYLRTAYPDPTARAAPRLYAVDDEKTLKIAPTPDAIYPINLRYFSYPTSIVDEAGGVSWLGTNFGFALLYGALRDAAIYLKEEVDVVAGYESKYAEALNEIKTFSRARAAVDQYRPRGK